MSVNLRELKKELFRDGVFNDEKVKILRDSLFDDEGMTLPKGNLLFEIKDELTSSGKRPESFDNLFIEGIAALLLEDEDSPGEIDDKEARWLRAQIKRNGHVEDLERNLLQVLRVKSINFPAMLNIKSARARKVEKCLYSTRYLAILAVVGSLLAAVVLFIRSTLYVGLGIFQFFKDSFCESISMSDRFSPQGLLPFFVESVDSYLFAMVLIIFGIGVYELFINKIDPAEQNLDSRPSWLQINSIDSLKSSLGNVILMVLIVSVFEHSLDIKFHDAWDLLKLSVDVVLIAIALYLTHLSHKGHNDHKKQL